MKSAWSHWSSVPYLFCGRVNQKQTKTLFIKVNQKAMFPPKLAKSSQMIRKRCRYILFLVSLPRRIEIIMDKIISIDVHKVSKLPLCHETYFTHSFHFQRHSDKD